MGDDIEIVHETGEREVNQKVWASQVEREVAHLRGESGVLHRRRHLVKRGQVPHENRLVIFGENAYRVLPHRRMVTYCLERQIPLKVVRPDSDKESYFLILPSEVESCRTREVPCHLRYDLQYFTVARSTHLILHFRLPGVIHYVKGSCNVELVRNYHPEGKEGMEKVKAVQDLPCFCEQGRHATQVEVKYYQAGNPRQVIWPPDAPTPDPGPPKKASLLCQYCPRENLFVTLLELQDQSGETLAHAEKSEGPYKGQSLWEEDEDEDYTPSEVPSDLEGEQLLSMEDEAEFMRLLESDSEEFEPTSMEVTG